MTRAIFAILTASFLLLTPAISHAQTNEQRTLVLVIGAPGEPDYAEKFTAWGKLWKQAASQAGMNIRAVG